MLSVLVKILGGYLIVGDRGFPRQANVTLEYLMRCRGS
jgi:hypothetical protein